MEYMAKAELVMDFAVASGLTCAGWLLSYALSLCIPAMYDFKGGNLIQKPPLANRLDAADGIFCVPYFFILLAFAIQSTLEVWAVGTIDARWHHVNRSGQWFIILYVTRMTTHIPIQWMTLANNEKLRLQMTAHHVLSVMCFGIGLITGRYIYPLTRPSTDAEGRAASTTCSVTILLPAQAPQSPSLSCFQHKHTSRTAQR